MTFTRRLGALGVALGRLVRITPAEDIGMLEKESAYLRKEADGMLATSKALIEILEHVKADGARHDLLTGLIAIANDLRKQAERLKLWLDD